MGRGERLKSLAREPLVHFLMAGLLVFLIASWRGTTVDPADRTILIDEDRVGLLASQFEQTWQRSPSPAEIDQLIRDYVKEEVYDREALRMGLDRDDPVIRRRLRSKMEFLAAAEVETAVPSDAALAAWLKQNPRPYAQGARYSLDQVYIGPANAPGSAAKAKAVLARLKAGADPAGMGAAISLPSQIDAMPVDRIANDFGDGFANALAHRPVGVWTGPVTSGFGVHLVRVTKAIPGQMPRLQDVRQQVENDWREATLTERQEKAYQALLDGYRVRIEKP